MGYSDIAMVINPNIGAIIPPCNIKESFKQTHKNVSTIFRVKLLICYLHELSRVPLYCLKIKDQPAFPLDYFYEPSSLL